MRAALRLMREGKIDQERLSLLVLQLDRLTVLGEGKGSGQVQF